MNKHVFVIIGIVFTALILFGVIHNTANERFTVEFFSGSNFSGYEQLPPTAQIDASPAIAWDHTSGVLKVLGWLCLGAMWFGLWYVGTDRYLGRSTINSKKGERKGVAYAVIFGPLILCMIFFLSAYSSGLEANSIAVERARFDGWIQTGAVKQRGEKTYVDAKGSDTLKTLFTGKAWIK